MILISIQVFRSKICLKEKKKKRDEQQELKIIRVTISLNHFMYKHTIISSTNSEHYSIEKSRLHATKEEYILPFIQQYIFNRFLIGWTERHNVSPQHFPYPDLFRL